MEWFRASLSLYTQFRDWWDKIDPILKDMTFLEEAPPHVFQVM